MKQQIKMKLKISTPLPRPVTLSPCEFKEYKKLSHFHYRQGSAGLISQCFGLYYPSTSLITREKRLIGIIVYAYPPLNSRLRNLATNRYFLTPPTRSERAKLINRDLRTISRVIIDPQFRSLGLASAIVRETLPLIEKPFIEASAVMGQFHPFFEKAGMIRHTAAPSPTKQKLHQAFANANIDKEALLDPSALKQKIESLPASALSTLNTQINRHYIAHRQAVFSSKINPDLNWLLPRLCSHLLTNPTYFLWQQAH
jgi:hypothetical protein